MAVYSPPGNLDGFYTENVLPTSTTSTKEMEDINLGTHPDSICDPDDVECKKICRPKPVLKFTAFHYNCLNSINDLRREHGVPSLNLSLECCEHSLQRANYIFEEDTVETLETKYGENVYLEYPTDNLSDINNEFAVPNVIKDWYKEGKLYNYAEPGYNSKTVNFTQMIWKNTSDMGSALLKADGRIIFVLSFLPPGNIRGQFGSNVFPPICNKGHNVHSNACGKHVARKPETPSLTHPYTDNDTFSYFQRLILKEHNELRSLHKSEPLTLDLNLCEIAATQAQVRYFIFDNIHQEVLII